MRGTQRQLRLQVLAMIGQSQLLRKHIAMHLSACARSTTASPLEEVLQSYDAATLADHFAAQAQTQGVRVRSQAAKPQLTLLSLLPSSSRQPRSVSCLATPLLPRPSCHVHKRDRWIRSLWAQAARRTAAA